MRRSGVRIDAELGSVAPAAWGNAIDLCVVPGGFGFHEVAMFHRPSRTLVLTDLVLKASTGSTELSSAALICVAVAVGSAACSRAAAPTTCGVAIEVPSMKP